jgi:Aerobic-type carbon monoxide dehydrogenase, large subunit CoxL/CutL homologs
MDKFGKSQPVKRVEDTRFLTGAGRYVDDIAPESALRAYVLRSPVAHGTIATLDVTEARAAPGVHLVVTGQDMLDAGYDTAMNATLTKNRDGTPAAAPKRPTLAEGRVRFVGEPVAMVVAETLEQARDAAELIELEIDDLPVVTELGPSRDVIHPEAPENRAFDFGIGDEDATAAAIDGAARVVRMEVTNNRIIANSMEPRGAFAEFEDGRLHLAFGGQGVWGMKAQLSRMLHLPPEQVRVTNHDVGGGFGTKTMPYPEYFALAHAAMTLGRPVRWMSERTEAMLSDNAGRDLVSMRNWP